MLSRRTGWMLGFGWFAVCVGSVNGAEHSCALIANATERLACYDLAFPPTVEQGVSPSFGRSEEEMKGQFGLSARQVDERRPESERDAQVESIEAVIQRIQAVRGGLRVVHLDNDQVWQLTEGGNRGPLKPGDQVTLRRALFGSYMLVTPGGIGLRARRVR